jgi:hypothetical protein
MRRSVCLFLFVAILPSWAIAQYTPHGLPEGMDSFYVAQAPGATQPPSLSTQSTDASQARFETGRSLARNTRTRASRAANMFGDSLPVVGHALFGPITPDTYAPIGLAGGGRYSKIGENNIAFTRDRVYFTYQNFGNAAPVSLSGGPFIDYDISQYTIGGEKTFLDGLASVEVRGGFLSDIDAFGPDASFDNGVINNLTVNFKLQLYETDDFGLVAGMGVGVPTGSDFQAYMSTGTSFSVDNQAVYLLPFVGATFAPTDNLFSTSFLQISTVTNGDSVLVNGAQVDNLNPQTTLHLSTSIGAWLISEDDGFGINGVAWLNEFHYTTALQDPDFVDQLGPFSEPISLATSAGRYNILNVTSGLHFQINDLTSFRIAGVFPIGADRTFDGEVQATLNQQF